jgi:hypothetical protein
MITAQNGKVKKMDLKRLRDLFSQYKTAERVFEEFRTFCRAVYGQKAIDLLLSNETIPLKPEKEGLAAKEVILSVIKQIEKPVFASQDIIQECNKLGHRYTLGTIYRTLNKLGKEQKLIKVPVSRGGKRAVDWKKIETQPASISKGNDEELRKPRLLSRQLPPQ